MSNHHKYKQHGFDNAPYGTQHQYGGASAQSRCDSQHGVGGGEAGQGNPGYGNPGYGNAEYGNPGYGNMGQGNRGYGNPGYGYPGQGNPSYGNSNHGNPGYGNPGYGNPGYGNPGYGNPAYANTGYGLPNNKDFWQGMSSYLPARHMDQFLVGLALGAGAAWVLSDEELRGKMIKAGMKLYANFAGSFEELKEQMADIRSEVATERHGDE